MSSFSSLPFSLCAAFFNNYCLLSQISISIEISLRDLFRSHLCHLSRIVNVEQVDIVYSDASILIDSTGEKAEAVFIRNGKISAIDSNKDVIKTAGPSVKNISVAGATITPGLVDTHPHILHFSAYAAGLINLSNVRNHGEIVALIRERASTTPKGERMITTPIGESSF